MRNVERRRCAAQELTGSQGADVAGRPPAATRLTGNPHASVWGPSPRIALAASLVRCGERRPRVSAA